MKIQYLPKNLFRVPLFKFYIIQTVLILIVIIFQLSVLSVNDWISQNISDSEIEWKGSLFQIYQSETFFQEDTYIELRNHWCDIADQLREQTGNYTSPQRTFCTTFNLYKSGGQAYVSFAIINSIVMFMIICILFLTFCIKGADFCLIGCSVFLGITNFVGIIFLVSYFKFVFNGNCDTLYNEEDTQPTSTCSETGPKIALIIFFIILLLACVSVWVGVQFNFSVAKKRKAARVNASQGYGEEVSNHLPNRDIPPHMVNQGQFAVENPQIPPQQMQMAQIPGYPPGVSLMEYPQQFPGFGVPQTGFPPGVQPIYVPVQMYPQAYPGQETPAYQYPSEFRQRDYGYFSADPSARRLREEQVKKI